MAKKKIKSSPKTTPEGRGVLYLSASIALLLSLISFSIGKDTHHLLGIIGYSTGLAFHFLFGIPSYIFALFLGWFGWRLFFNKAINDITLKTLNIAIFVISSCFLLSILESQKPLIAKKAIDFFYPLAKEGKTVLHLGGTPAYFLYKELPLFNLEKLINWVGVACLFASTWLASVLYLTKLSPFHIYNNAKDKLLAIKLPSSGSIALPQEPVESPRVEKRVESEVTRYVKSRNEEAGPVETHEAPAPKPKPAPKREVKIAPTPVPGQYTLPPVELLTNAKKIDQTNLKQHLKKMSEILEETFHSFGIEAKVGQINCGPTITSFEVHPAIGVKVQKIKALENDLALSMEAKTIRIIAPIPGKAAVGIEVPNLQPQEVGFKEMLSNYQEGPQKFKIPILLGKAVNGDYVISDLAKWPHGIIAGATGSGKSVCINTIVMSILHNASPDEIKLLMVDPKKVELTPYSNLPHMLAPVITEPRDACAALNWLVREMEKRYELLKAIGTRNIDSFNTRVINEELEASLEMEVPKKLPYYVAIIDELADLMMVASSDIETPIARIAQMARAVGIHLILATQRPSREVITGLIKANFPTRIAFKVASRINSQIILDEIGAESLLGNGDMLFLPPGTSTLVRAQGAYIRDEDIQSVIRFIGNQAPPNYIIQSFKNMEISSSPAMLDDEPTDALYEQALEVILSTGNASTTFLQRKLKIGYARAASLIDQLEQKGVVSPAEGAKPRKILVGRSKEKQDDFFEDLEL
ncbi:MAG: DNA translocase FtsK [Parachlamydiaceae bacterium]